MSKYQEAAERALAHLGGAANVIEVENCITRMRVEVRDLSAVNMDALKQTPMVLGVVDDGTGNVQVVFGPGAVDKVTTAVEALLAAAPKPAGGSDAERLAAEGAAIKAAQKAKNDTPFKRLLRRIANIFVPLIPALIGAGIIAGLNGVLINVANANKENSDIWVEILKWTPAIGAITAGFMVIALPIMVGHNAAKEFGGTPMIGAALAGIAFSPAISNVILIGGDMVLDPATNTEVPQKLAFAQGGVLGAMFVAILGAYIERWVRRWAPDSISMLVVPTVTMLLAGSASILVVLTGAGKVTVWIGEGANWLLAHAGGFAGFVLGGFFLPLVMLGLHQALIPIHTTLITDVGYTTLLPILAMAGAGQVGAAIAVWARLARNRSMRSVIRSALPAGFLGVGEPLIYGVSLPLGRPFITACIGGAFGGGFIGLMGQLGTTVGAKAVGPSGWALFPLLDGSKGIGPAIMVYAVGLLIGYVVGFLATYFFGFSASMLIELNDDDVPAEVTQQATQNSEAALATAAR